MASGSSQPPEAQSSKTATKTVYSSKEGGSKSVLNVSSEDRKTSNGVDIKQSNNKRKSCDAKEEPNKKFKVKKIEELDSEEKYILSSVVKFLLDHKDATIEDFLEYSKDSIPPSGMPKINQDLITKYGKFICEEVFYMVKFSNEKYMHIPSTPFIEKLHKSVLKDEEDKELEAVSTPLIDEICAQVSSYAKQHSDHLEMKEVFPKSFIQCISVTETTDKRIYHESMMIGNIKLTSSDYVCIKKDKELLVGKIAYFFINKEDCQKMVHLIWLVSANKTILGETADPQEYFLSDECDSVKVNDLKGTVSVCFNSTSPDSYFFSKKYESSTGRFVDILETDLMCPFGDHGKKLETPTIENSESKNGLSVKWNGEEYSVGDCVFLLPSVVKVKKPVLKCKLNFDKTLYPEAHRKGPKDDSLRRPFCIGLITNIKTGKPIRQQSSYSFRNHKNNDSEISVEFLKFHRPENLNRKELLEGDLHEIYASDHVMKTKFSNVVRKCSVIYAKDLTKKEIKEWTDGSTDRFYFKSAYVISTGEFIEPREDFKRLNKGLKEFERSPSLKRGLRCFDIFAGCGGLSEGLRQSGVADIKWAIEKDLAASRSYQMNNSSATVFNAGCNTILSAILHGQLTDEHGQEFPKKGEVELLCGGPPCQGFSKINRFSGEFNSKVMNSLIVTFISYCDVYRPRFAIMENVKNFVSFQNGIALKLLVRCLLKMGYQIAFRVLEAGSYGVPQKRKRFFLIAAASGEILPEFPAVTHAFLPETSIKMCTMGNISFPLNPSRDIFAPFRAITVRDAISDLPNIPNGFNKTIEYATPPSSHFQRQLRNENESLLYDHICKKVSPLVEARISLVPPGGDWRDLPNKCVKLSDGKVTHKVIYCHHKLNKPANFPATGVCRCISGKSCHLDDKQSQTLIPWSLIHTADRNNNWQGVYGRLEWDRFFSTIVTNPDPMGKQGRILHPEQNRILSVREYARSQGFTDDFQFYGLISEKYQQIGNAVPPPLAAAIGLEMKKSLLIKDDDMVDVSSIEKETLDTVDVSPIKTDTL